MSGLSMKNQNACGAQEKIEMYKNNKRTKTKRPTPKGRPFRYCNYERLTSWPEPEPPGPEQQAPPGQPEPPHQPSGLPPPEQQQAWELLSSGRRRRPSAPGGPQTEQSTFSWNRFPYCLELVYQVVGRRLFQGEFTSRTHILRKIAKCSIAVIAYKDSKFRLIQFGCRQHQAGR